MLKSTKNK